MKSLSRVRLFATPMDCSLPGSSVHGIFQARILEWVALSFYRRSSRPRDWTRVSRIVGRRFPVWATKEKDCLTSFLFLQWPFLLICCSVAKAHAALCDPMACSTPGLSLTPAVYSNPCPSSRWCHPTISSSVVPSSSRLQPFPASGSFPVSRLFSSGSQSDGASASASVLPMTIQDWSLGWTGLISCSSRDSSLLQHQSSKASILRHSAFFIVQLSYPYMTTGKTVALTRQTFVGKVMSLL